MVDVIVLVCKNNCQVVMIVIKGCLKQLLYSQTTMTYEQVISRIRDYSCVSFDVFDTLVKRCVSEPSDVFLYMIAMYNDKYKKNIDSNQFLVDRKNAALLAKKKADANGVNEITLDDIYANLEQKYIDYKELKNEEINAEIRVCHADPIMRKVFEWCIYMGKKIFLVSDMYLPEGVLEAILHKCGYSEFDDIYVSSNIGLKKSDGKLFDYVIKKNNLNVNELVHIGDNYKSDYIQAKKKKMNAVLIATNPKRTKFTRVPIGDAKNKKLFSLKTILDGYVDESWSLYYQYGFEVLGPLVFGFLKWMHNSALLGNIDKLLFLSRDGLLLQKAYNLLYEDDTISNGYFYVSRNALTKAIICKKDSLKDVFINGSRGHWNFQMLCERLGIDIKKGATDWTDCGLSVDQRFSTEELVSNKSIEAFLDKYRKQILTNSLEQYDLLAKYIKQELVSSVGLVDLGWAGTIQRAMNDIIEFEQFDYSMCGFYMSINNKVSQGINVRAFIPQNENVSNYVGALVEFPFTSSDGMTNAYLQCDNGVVVPDFKENEYKVTGDVKELSIIEEIQKGALDFIAEMRCVRDFYELDWKTAYHNLRMATKAPRNLEIAMFGNLLFYNDCMLKLAAPKRLLYYLVNPRCLRRDLSAAGWKHGFLKKMFIIPFPYNSFIEFITRKEK